MTGGSGPRLRIGVDLGGTKIEAALLGPGGEERARLRVPTPQGDYEATLRRLAELAGAVAERGGAASATPPSVGVGAPGALSPATGLMKNANSTCLNGRPLDRDLAEALGRPVRLANDANCFALSEAVDGAAADAGVVFGAILGTGGGGGIAGGRAVLTGRNAIAGEWGHWPLPAPGPDETPGPACYCGRRGCVEAWCSGPGLAADFARAGGAAGLDGAGVAALAEAGDPAAEAALARHADRLGRALAQVANLLDPDVIVLGGGLSKLPNLPETLTRTLRPHVFSDEVATAVRLNRHGDSSGVRGAAWLWPDPGPTPGP